MPSTYSKRTLRELATIIFSRWLAIILITVIIAGATVLACQIMPKVYRSEETLWARQSKPANPLESVPDPMSRLEVFLKTQQQIIMSDMVLRRTMVRLEDSKLRVSPQDISENPLADNSVWQKWYDEVGKQAGKISGEEVLKFKKRVKIVTPGGEDVAKSEVFTIMVEQPEPVERAQLATELLTQEYLMHRRKLQGQMDESSKVLLTKQLDDLRDKILGTAEKKFSDYIQQNIKGDLLELAQLQRANTEVHHQRIRTAFQEDLIKIDAEISEYEALKTEVSLQIPKKALEGKIDTLTKEDIRASSLVIPEKVLKNNPVINKLKMKLADLIVARNSLNVQYEDKFALVGQKSGEIFKTTVDIIRELVAELKAIDQHIVTLKARHEEITRKVAERTKSIDNLSSMFVTYESLSREVELARSLYEQKRKELLDAETARQMAQQEILIVRVNQATLPDVNNPVRPILWLYTTLSIVIGLLIGISYAFLADSYDHTVTSIDQAERYFGKPILVSIPRVSGGLIK